MKYRSGQDPDGHFFHINEPDEDEAYERGVEQDPRLADPDPCPGCGDPSGPCEDCACVRTDDRE